jgi:MFS family permease
LFIISIGILAERFGAKWIFGCGILIAGILSLLTPIAARTHVGLLIAIRIIIGIFEVKKIFLMK